MYIKNIPRWLKIVVYATILVLALLYISPYLWMVLSSFRSSADPFSASIMPSRLVLDNYIKVFREGTLLTYFRNSLVVATGAASLTMVLAIPASYGFSRFRFRGHGVLMSFLLVIRTFPGLLIAIALFVMVVEVGLYDSHIPLILANAMLNLPFAIWNLRTVFDELSPELEESAMVEGATRLQALIRVLLPISLPGLAATFAFVFILSWNEYLFATNFITSAGKRLIPTVIATSIGQFTIDYASLLTLSVLATVPIIIIFAFIQRYIITGLSMGSVKG